MSLAAIADKHELVSPKTKNASGFTFFKMSSISEIIFQIVFEAFLLQTKKYFWFLYT